VSRWPLGALAVLVAASLLGACTNEPKPSLLGAWEAEEVRIQSLVMPAGPDFEVTASEVRLAAGTVSMPLQTMEATGREVTLRFPMGLGWTFHFEGPDRLFMDVPFAGKVYYRRKAASLVATQVVPAQPAPAPPSARPPAATAAVATATVPGADRLLEQAALLVQSDSEAALRLLDASLREGLRPAQRIEDDARFDALRQDVRYHALMARYR
jgi:hypothetical protein